MIPYESNLATAVPEALDVRLAIIRAIGAHKEQCDNERARLRRAEIAFLRHELKGIAQDLRKVGRECLFLIRSELRKAGFNPNEPRVPAGNPDGGQWANDGRPPANESQVLSDAPDGGWIPGAQYAADGHHWVPKAVYGKYSLRPETKKVFDNSTSGPLADDSVNRWNIEHRTYNEAVNEAFTAYLKKNTIVADQMTPEQAEEILGEVKGSTDPRIRMLRMKILRQSLRYFWVFGPRGGGDEE
ncbi:MAG: hypothetical protein WB624_22545 [Xanthobacteraceae bacterium]|jgi:hypothetical protein